MCRAAYRGVVGVRSWLSAMNGSRDSEEVFAGRSQLHTGTSLHRSER
jgi:hypothetical protein